MRGSASILNTWSELGCTQGIYHTFSPSPEEEAQAWRGLNKLIRATKASKEHRGAQLWSFFGLLGYKADLLNEQQRINGG